MGKIKNFRIRGGNKEVRSHIKDLCEQIVRAVHPRKIILFGSYAYGQPHEDSDVDLLVVMPVDGHPAYKAAEIRMKIETPMALDLLVRTPEFVAERVRQDDLFMREITEQGKIIYEAEHATVG